MMKALNVDTRPIVSARRKIHTMYAVIETGGKQYRANVGDKFRIEKLPGETSTEIIFDKVLVVGGEGETRFGNPYVSGARVTAEIIKQGRGDKVLVFKYKSKKNIRKKVIVSTSPKWKSRTSKHKERIRQWHTRKVKEVQPTAETVSRSTEA